MRRGLKEIRCSPSAATGSSTSEEGELGGGLAFLARQRRDLPVKHYGSTLEIGHIVSLELGGSNDIANLYPVGVRAAVPR